MLSLLMAITATLLTCAFHVLQALAPPDDEPDVDFDVSVPESKGWQTEWVGANEWEGDDEESVVSTSFHCLTSLPSPAVVFTAI